MWVITNGSKSTKDVVVACKEGNDDVISELLKQTHQYVVSTLECIPPNQCFSMFCTNLIVKDNFLSCRKESFSLFKRSNVVAAGISA